MDHAHATIVILSNTSGKTEAPGAWSMVFSVRQNLGSAICFALHPLWDLNWLCCLSEPHKQEGVGLPDLVVMSTKYMRKHVES